MYVYGYLRLMTVEFLKEKGDTFCNFKELNLQLISKKERVRQRLQESRTIIMKNLRTNSLLSFEKKMELLTNLPILKHLNKLCHRKEKPDSLKNIRRKSINFK